MGYQIVDAFPAFRTWWCGARRLPVPAQVEAWAEGYMAAWPELLAKQEESYAEDGLDWRQVARERVFPFLAARLPAMELAHGYLLAECGPIHARACEALGWRSDVTFVIYVGIGCGAGWAARYSGAPAVLFGLENVAECGWSEPAPLRGLIAHELAHLAHFDWREQAGLAHGSGPWWDLYEEGLAQRCEHVTLGGDSWHMATAYSGEDWLSWCREHVSWLAGEYLRRAEAGEDVRPFFGSWFELGGHRECGYFLGHEVIRALQRELSLREIALLQQAEVESRCREVLAALAGISRSTGRCGLR